MIASLILALSLQATGEIPFAVKNDNPETWSVEYPRSIEGQVADYRRCLVVTNRRIAGKADIEAQHSADLARCSARKAKAIAEANALLAGAKTTLSPAEVDTLFENIGKIHVARGRDLDQQFNARVAGSQVASEAYEASRPKGLVLELRDASVVKSRAETATPPAATPKTDKDGK